MYCHRHCTGEDRRVIALPPIFSIAPGTMACGNIHMSVYAITGCAHEPKSYCYALCILDSFAPYYNLGAPLTLCLLPTLLELLSTCAKHRLHLFITGESGLVFRGQLASGELVAVKTVKGEQ